MTGYPLILKLLVAGAPLYWCFIFIPACVAYSNRCARRENGVNLERES